MRKKISEPTSSEPTSSETKADRLLRPAEAAEFLSSTEKTLECWRRLHRGPRFLRFNARGVRYRESDLLEWLRTRVVETDDYSTAGAA